MVKAEHAGLLVVISSSDEEEAHDVNAVWQVDQVEAATEIIEPNICLWCKEQLLEGEAKINSSVPTSRLPPGLRKVMACW